MNKNAIVVSQRDPQPFLICGFLKFSGEGTDCCMVVVLSQLAIRSFFLVFFFTASLLAANGPW